VAGYGHAYPDIASLVCVDGTFFTVGKHIATDTQERPVHALTDPIKEVRAAAVARLTELETALVAHGFGVIVETTFWKITVSVRAGVLAPANTMHVQIAASPTGLAWYWVRSAIDDVEYLAPAAAVAEVTERIAAALRTAGRP
jgi:hypothetical protein